MSDESAFVLIDPKNYDINKFTMDPASLKEQSFTGEKGENISYYNGTLKYDGKIPFFSIEGDTYGVQKDSDKNKKGKKDGETALPKGAMPLPVISQLPPGLGAAPSQPVQTLGPDGKPIPKKKEKCQVAFILTEKADPKQWTQAEQDFIRFLETDLRKILATVLVRNINIVSTIAPSVIPEAQRKIQEEMMDPEKRKNLMDTASQQARFAQIVYDLVYSLTVGKAYRQKKKAPPGETLKIDIMDPNSQYDLTKFPSVNATIMNYIDKDTKEEVVSTVYQKYVDGVDPSQFPFLTHAEALALGRYRFQGGIRLDKTYLGTKSISSQLQVGRLLALNPIASTSSSNTGISMPVPVVKKDSRLVQRTIIQPGGGSAPLNGVPYGAPPPVGAPANGGFDPAAAFAGVPGFGGLNSNN